MCRHYLDEIDHLTPTADQLDQRITALLTRLEHNKDVENLDTIPGIGPAAAEIISAETGGDMAQFATVGHLACWIGVCPGMNESAGVTKSARTRNGNCNLKRLLGIAAMSVTRNKDCYLSAYYRRIAARRRRQRALVAVMHKLAFAIWHILRHKTRYQDLGADYFTRRAPERTMRRMTKEANRLGLTVRFEPIATTV
ncbi:transposase [Streptomyces sp. NPDC058320]|uniref:transposase n=1 Tax=unclassified Streptomyces TaxID=2593676 RepID=UPI0036374C1C